jgi:signal peptidase II
VRRVVLIAGLIALADQLTKWLVLRLVDPEYPVAVINGLFRLVNWGNTGAAWGMFKDWNIQLGVFSVLIVIALYLFRHSFGIHLVGCQVALGLIVGGIAGNSIDRFWHGYVVDFLDFFVGEHHWPAFNVADSAICCGVVLYIIASYCADRHVRSRASVRV